MKRFHHTLTSLVTVVLALFIGFAAPAQVIAPAGIKLNIKITVTHGDDTTGTEKEFGGTAVTLSPVAPTLSAPINQFSVPG